MISKLLIVDVNVSNEVRNILNNVKRNDVIITYYNYNKGFIVDNKNLLVNEILVLIRSYLETHTINLEHLCFMNFKQMETAGCSLALIQCHSHKAAWV